jgi:hypothetical protein
MMTTHPPTTAQTSSAPVHRHICAWCRRDLGALQHASQHDSYGICQVCTRQYFGSLYEADRSLQPASLQQRAIGEEPARWRYSGGQ